MHILIAQCWQRVFAGPAIYKFGLSIRMAATMVRATHIFWTENATETLNSDLPI